MDFIAEILKWYEINKRDLPWRKTKNPYLIWISEVILQQTRVEQGLPYYYRFVDHFPTVFALAEANEQEVLKYWQGLGYYSRARNLHAAAKQIVHDFNGNFPSDYNDIIKLKGVGHYTASAIASFCFNQKTPVLDGNVYRVISRIFAINAPIDKGSSKKVFLEVLQSLIEPYSPALFNQAIMEFGAIQCKPQAPACAVCVVKEYCLALKNNKVNELPVKAGKTKLKEEYWYYWLIQYKNELLFRHRSNKGIWKNMYDFVCIESTNKLTLNEIYNEQQKQHLFLQKKLKDINLIEQKVHLLSHRKLNISFISANLTTKVSLPDNYVFKNRVTYKKLPLPKVIADFLKYKKEW